MVLWHLWCKVGLSDLAQGALVFERRAPNPMPRTPIAQIPY